MKTWLSKIFGKVQKPPSAAGDAAVAPQADSEQTLPADMGRTVLASTPAGSQAIHAGMEGDFGLLSMPELFIYAEAVSSPIYQRVSEGACRVLKQEMENTRKLLEENRTHLDAVSKALLEKLRLYRNDLQQLLPQCPRGEKYSSTPTQNLVT